MSRDDKDLPLGDISGIEVDDNPTPKAAPAPKKAPAPKRKPQAASPTKPQPQPDPSGSKGLWALVILLLVLVIGLAAAGFFFYQQFETVKAQLDHELSQSDERLGSLATELSSTGESVTSHIAALKKAADDLAQQQKKLEEEQKKHLEEIRKLWDLSNKRNKSQIEANEKEIAALKASLGEQKKAAEAVAASMKKAQEEAAKALKRADEAESKVASQGSRQTQLETQLSLVDETQKQLQAELKKLQSVADAMPELKALAALQKSGQGVEGRLKALEEAVDAFDQYRRQVNQRLEALE